MIRFLAIVAAAALISYPPFLLYDMSIPVPEFRKGTYVDFLTFAGAVLIIYGGVLAGVAVHWARVGRARQGLFPVFKAGVWGAFAYDAQIPPVVYLSGVLMFVGGLARASVAAS